MRERRRKQTLIIEGETLRKAYGYFLQEKRAENLSTDTLTVYQMRIENFLIRLVAFVRFVCYTYAISKLTANSTRKKEIAK